MLFFESAICRHIFQGSCSVPLGIAAEKGHVDVVRRLLAAGANADRQNKVCNNNKNPQLF